MGRGGKGPIIVREGVFFRTSSVHGMKGGRKRSPANEEVFPVNKEKKGSKAKKKKEREKKKGDKVHFHLTERTVSNAFSSGKKQFHPLKIKGGGGGGDDERRKEEGMTNILNGRKERVTNVKKKRRLIVLHKNDYRKKGGGLVSRMIAVAEKGGFLLKKGGGLRRNLRKKRFPANLVRQQGGGTDSIQNERVCVENKNYAKKRK